MEGMRIRWCGRASNPVGDVKRFPVGSTPATFRHISRFNEYTIGILANSAIDIAVTWRRMWL
jgi:hypothetical protein